MTKNIIILLILFISALFNGCGSDNTLKENQNETNLTNLTKKIIFSFPQEYYDNFELYYDWSDIKPKRKYSVRKFGFNKEKKFSSNTFILENETLTKEPSSFESGYELKNGKWVKTNTNTQFNALLSHKNLIATLDDKYEFKIKSIQDIENKSIPIKGSDKNITMPKDAKLTTIEVRVIKNLFELDYQEDYASLDEVIQNNCNKNYLLPIQEVDDVIAISFKCEQQNLIKGTLIGIKKDESIIEDVGSWEKTKLENSDINALLISIDTKYNKNNDTPFFAIKDKTVWKGYYDKKDTKFEIKGYNKIALDAFISKTEELSKMDQDNIIPKNLILNENNRSSTKKITLNSDANSSEIIYEGQHKESL